MSDAGLAELAESAATLIDDLLWWSATVEDGGVRPSAAGIQPDKSFGALAADRQLVHRFVPSGRT